MDLKFWFEMHKRNQISCSFFLSLSIYAWFTSVKSWIKRVSEGGTLNPLSNRSNKPAFDPSTLWIGLIQHWLRKTYFVMQYLSFLSRLLILFITWLFQQPLYTLSQSACPSWCFVCIIVWRPFDFIQHKIEQFYFLLYLGLKRIYKFINNTVFYYFYCELISHELMDNF